jgi:hypothetical protein
MYDIYIITFKFCILPKSTEFNYCVENSSNDMHERQAIHSDEIYHLLTLT